MDWRFIEHIERRLREPLPGEEAQFRMAHLSRRSYEGVPSHAVNAAVLALFFPKNGDWHLVFIERESLNPKDRHRGQISFPGGRFDTEDITLDNTALREAQEEIGVDPDRIRLLGELTNIYIPVSNFHVHPFVGVMDHLPAFLPQAGEVKDILEVPFELFLQPGNIGHTTITVADSFTLKDVPYFDINGKVLWGATAMMMSELLEVVGPQRTPGF